MKSQLGIFTTDRNLVILTWDAWLEQITGRSDATVCGKSLTEAFPDLESRDLIPAFRRALEQGAVEILAPAFHGYLIACSPQSPSSRFEHMQQRVLITPLREQSDISGLAVTVEDVTSRREREVQLESGLSDDNWRVRQKAVEGLMEETEQSPVADLVKRLCKEHRNPSVLNSILQLLASGAWEALEPLVDLTRDGDLEVRMYSALALGELKDRRAIPALMELLKDPDANVRYHAIEALSHLKAIEAADELAGIAVSGDFFLAFAALEALSSIGEVRVAPRLVPLLGNDMLRAAAAGTLANLGDAGIVPPIAALMEHRNLIPVIAQALAALHRRYDALYNEGEYIAALVRRHAPPSAAQNLLDTLNNVTGETLRVMIRILGWVGDEGTVRNLTRLLGSAEVRADVIETLVRHGDSVTEPLCRQLESDDFDTRRAAIIALARIGDPLSVPVLVRALDDPELTIEAAGALAKIGDPRAYDPLLKLLSHPRAAVRQAAVGGLNSLGHPRTVEDVRRLLSDSNANVRESAVRIAGYFGYAECAGLLLELVHDPEQNVRRAAIENLPQVEDERVLATLLDASRDPSPKIRGAAIQSLGQLDAPATLPDLLHALQDEDSWVRYYAARALGQLRSPEAIDGLAAGLLSDAANHVRIAAAESLGSIGGRRVVAILSPLVEAEDSDLARAALMALGSVGHPDSLQPILTILRSGNPRRLDAVRAIALRRDRTAVDALQWTAGADEDLAICEAAVDELARMATPESIAALVRLTAGRRLREHVVAALSRQSPANIPYIAKGLLQRPQLEVRRAVIDALGRMKHPAASEVLGAALDDEQPEVRAAAIQALGRLGSHTSEKKLLLMARSDPDPAVQSAAEQALER